MNKIFRFLAVALVLGALVQSCESGAEESDNTPDVGDNTGGSKPDSGSTEAGAPKFLEVNPGDGRAEVVWLVNGAESDVKYSYFYYTSEAGKTNESLQATGKSADTLRKMISMAEGRYTISAKNYYESKKEYSASSEELTVDVYGDIYKDGLEACPVTPTFTAEAGGLLTWGEAEGCVGNTIIYLDRDSKEIELFCPIEDGATVLENVNGGSTVKYRSHYMPAVNAIDEVVTATRTLILPTDGIVEVSSLELLAPYLSMSDVEVKLAPGTYRVTASDLNMGIYGDFVSEIEEGNPRQVLFMFSGENSTYDFTDVIVEVEAGVWTNQSSSYNEFVNIQTIGNKNHIKNLTLIDIATSANAPSRGYTNIMLDGANNTIEGVSVTSTGSYPYGYGEVFGKGGPYTVGGIKKHCGCLVRGNYNHVLNCKIVHHAYGHCLFMQGAKSPVIEGCHIESEMRSTNDMLAETGTVGANVGFKTYFGYIIPKDFTLALSEEGIRAYITGNTMVNGVRFPNRPTTDPKILNCYIKTARAGVTLTHATGTRYVEGCTTIGCERGYAPGKGGVVVDCYSDCSYGPALGVDYYTDSGIKADITILANELDYKGGNGSKHVATIIGNNHDITFHNDPDSPTPVYDSRQELFINMGGDNRTIGMLATDNEFPATNIKLTNHTGYKIVMDENATGNTIITEGDVDVEVDGKNTITAKGKKTVTGVVPFVSTVVYPD